MKKTLSTLLIFLLSGALFAQDVFRDGLGGDIERAGSLNHSYEVAPDNDTPAPSGYKPFYISHYGRHGSRRQIGTTSTEAHKYLSEAEKAGNLTGLGLRLLQDVTPIYESHLGMDGDLTLRGGLEHQGIAKRMYERFTPVFRSKSRNFVHVRSSSVQRCILSSANFTSSLALKAPGLRFDFIAGNKYLNIFAHDPYERSSWRERSNAILDSLMAELIQPDRLVSAVFADPSKVDDPRRFARYLFSYAAGAQCLREELGGHSIWDYFSQDEIIGLGKFFNERYFATMGNNLEFGDNILYVGTFLVDDIVERADIALASDSDVAADLRFGHDSGLLPLAFLIAIDGYSEAYHIGDAWKNGFFLWERIPMGSNIQIVFYRGKKGADDVLVKILFNERERCIPALDARLGRTSRNPYYRWSDLREYLLDRNAAVMASLGL